MKIILLNKILPKTGVSTHQISLCKQFKKMGVEPIVFSGYVDSEILERFEKLNVEIKRLPFPTGQGLKQNIFLQILLYIMSIPRYLYLIYKVKPDIVHVHWPVTSFLASFSRKIFKIPFIVTHHISGINDNMFRTQANKAVATCKDLQNELISNFNYKLDNVDLIYNGIDVGHFNYNERPVSAERFTICHVGSLNRRKGIDTLVKAYKSLDIAGKELILQGFGSEDFIQELKTENNICESDNISFIGFGDSRETFSLSDCFVLASEKEGFVLTPLESMASGLPVIRSICEGTFEQIDEGVNGLTFPVGDVEQLKVALETVYLDPVLRATLARNGRKKVEKQFTEELMASKLVKTYRSVL